jgi:hypothetical protein
MRPIVQSEFVVERRRWVVSTDVVNCTQQGKAAAEATLTTSSREEKQKRG